MSNKSQPIVHRCFCCDCDCLQEVESAAGLIFQLYQLRINSADASALTSIISSCKDLKLYSRTLLSAVLARAKTLLQQQLQGFEGNGEGFSGRQLGVLLHSLAVLGLKPGDAWLRLAVVAAGGGGWAAVTAGN